MMAGTILVQGDQSKGLRKNIEISLVVSDKWIFKVFFIDIYGK